QPGRGHRIRRQVHPAPAAGDQPAGRTSGDVEVRSFAAQGQDAGSLRSVRRRDERPSVLQERWYGFDDGLYAACRLLELVSILSGDAEQTTGLFSRHPAGWNTPEINLEVGEQRKFALIEALQKNADWGEDARVTGIDGIRVDYPDSWGLVRASNTTPVLVLRFEAEDAAGLERI